MERREKKRDRERGARSAGWLRSKDRKYGSEFRVSRMIYRNLNPRGSRLTSSSSSGITPLSGQTKTSRVSIYLFSINAGTTDRTRCSEAERRWRIVSGKERERMETLPPPPLFSGYSSGIFNYSLGERWWREGRKEGEENNAAGAPSRAASSAHAPLCLPRTSNCFGLVQTLPLPEIAYLCMQLAPMQPVAPVCSPFYRRNRAPSKSDSLK